MVFFRWKERELALLRRIAHLENTLRQEHAPLLWTFLITQDGQQEEILAAIRTFKEVVAYQPVGGDCLLIGLEGEERVVHAAVQHITVLIGTHIIQSSPGGEFWDW